MAVLIVGEVLGEIADARDMFYDGPSYRDREVRERLDKWAKKLESAWGALKPREP
jgi:hypothetical protein